MTRWTLCVALLPFNLNPLSCFAQQARIATLDAELLRSYVGSYSLPGPSSHAAARRPPPSVDVGSNESFGH